MITARLTAFNLPLTRPLPLQGGLLQERAGILICLTDPSGEVGHGEATPWNPRDLRAVCQALHQVFPELADLHPGESSLADLPWADHPAARFALEGAWLDLQSKRQGVSLQQHLGRPTPASGVALNAFIPHVAPAEAARLALLYAEEGYRTIKVKIGRPSFRDDLAVLRSIRSVVPPTLRLRADVNGGWSAADALKNLQQMETLDLEYVEQPVASVHAMARLRRESPIPLAADESLTGVEAIGPLLEQSAADRWILKPMRFGGFREIEEALVGARSAGIPVTLTGMFEGAVATATLLHLAAAWLPPDTVCGLTPGLFSGAVNVHLPAPQQGVWPVPAGPGIGVAPHDEEKACA